MHILCKNCQSKLSVPEIETPAMKSFGEVRVFLGQFLGTGLDRGEMLNMLVQKLNGKIIGVRWRDIHPEEKSCISYLNRLKIARSFRRQGLAKLLLRTALLRSRAHVDRAFAVTLHDGPSGLVRKLGAREIAKSEMLRHVPARLVERYGKEHRYWVFEL